MNILVNNNEGFPEFQIATLLRGLRWTRRVILLRIQQIRVGVDSEVTWSVARLKFGVETA
jgi:hypothetical protein